MGEVVGVLASASLLAKATSICWAYMEKLLCAAGDVVYARKMLVSEMRAIGILDTSVNVFRSNSSAK